MKKVLVLGGNGFIGKNLISILSKNPLMSVTYFDKSLPETRLKNVKYIQGDFFSDADLQNSLTDIDIVIHSLCTIQPGNSNEKFLQAYSRDLVQTAKLCSMLSEKGIDMIFISSGGTVYGDQPIMPISEAAKLQPINHYGCLKACIENIITVFNIQNNAKMKIARVSNPYGPGQDFGKGVGFIDAAIKAALGHKDMVVWGDGEIVRDYIYIEDVCNAICAMISYDGDETVFNIGTGVGTSQNQVIQYVKEIVGEINVKFTASRGIDLKENVLDNTKMIDLLNTKVRDLKTGIYSYYQFLKNNI